MNKEFITDFKVHPYTQPNFFGYGRIEISLVTARSNILLWPKSRRRSTHVSGTSLCDLFSLSVTACLLLPFSFNSSSISFTTCTFFRYTATSSKFQLFAFTQSIGLSTLCFCFLLSGHRLSSSRTFSGLAFFQIFFFNRLFSADAKGILQSRTTASPTPLIYLAQNRGAVIL